MKSLRLVLVAVFGFALGAALFHAPTVKAQGRVRVEIYHEGIMAPPISGTPVGISCLEKGQQGTVCYILTQ